MTVTRSARREGEPPVYSASEDFVMLDTNGGIPYRPRDQSEDKSNLQAKGDGLDLQLRSLSQDNGVIITIQPPKQPQQERAYNHVDIVLVIDISGSMHWSAPLPDTQDEVERESAGLSVLDLTKHAARTVLAPLTENDRLALVVFSSDAKVVQELTWMTKAAKMQLDKKIESLATESATNLWSGIKTGLDLFKNATFNDNVQGMFVLTDGMPNHMCPPQGYVNKLKPILADMSSLRPSVPAIHTFGFGYEMRSDLMMSIAEVGNGNYAFIPDAGMIGTIFVHAMANLLSTFSADAVLELTTSRAEDLQCSTVFNVETPNSKTMILRLGSIQYGQSRNLVLTSKKPGSTPKILRATLKYKTPSLDNLDIDQDTKLITATTNSPTEVALESLTAYHIFRSQLCELLGSYFPVQDSNEHVALVYSGTDSSTFQLGRKKVDALVRRISESPYIEDINIKSLLTDLVGADPAGQIAKALDTGTPSIKKTSLPIFGRHRMSPGGSKTNFYQRWGRHYLPSLLHAHARQVCNSFKDAGPLRYGIDSPLFIRFRNEMDAAFENLPAPKPTRPQTVRSDGTSVPYTKIRSMARYHSSSNVCFEGQSKIRLAGDLVIPINKLRATMEVWTPTGPTKVVAVLKTNPTMKCKDELVRVGDLWVTPYHPILDKGEWVFPADIAEESKLCQTAVYSVLLTRSSNSDDHVIEVGGRMATTLGHGITQSTEENFVRSHVFFGNHLKVKRSLMKLLTAADGSGHFLCAGVERDAAGLVCGFKGAESSEAVMRSTLRKSKLEGGRRSPAYRFRVQKAVSVGA